ncbi:MAG TPA: fatty acid desaturase, partial [Bryobacteraceae bacterium]
QGAVLVAAPTAAAIVLGVWWNSNTIAHNFLHRPFFRSRAANRAFAAYLTLLVGIPQRLWKDRHLAHHAGRPWRLDVSVELAMQTALVVGLWAALALGAPAFFVRVYLPGYLAGLGLCWLHGHYEHARGTTSCYARWYNVLCFNDGFHSEHHARPGMHWTALRRDTGTRASVWPAPVRWLDDLERLALRWRALRVWLVRCHRRAIARLGVSGRRVGVVGGGLFPRTALALRELWPDARITVIDASRENLDEARRWVSGVEFVHARYSGGGDFDLVVIPLAFVGDREAIYARPPAPAVIVHDWIWRRRGESRMVSLALAKRVNLVRQ